jgi:dTDP-4-dehydrorhamnose reductase
MKVIVTGAGGMLACAFLNRLRELNWDAVAYTHAELDINDSQAVAQLKSHKADVILHCGAYTKVDRAEQERDLCRRINVEGTQNIAKLAHDMKAKLVYPQTFLVFGECEAPLSEDAPEEPLSYYAQSKSEGEKIAAQECNNLLVIRKGGLFGGDERDKNFVGNFANKLISMAKSRTKFLEVGDRIWQPTWAFDVAVWTCQLLERNARGTFNMASAGEASFYDTAVVIRDALGLSEQLELRRIDASLLAARELAKRPLRATLDCRKIQDALGMELPFWKNRLQTYLSSPYFLELNVRS